MENSIQHPSLTFRVPGNALRFNLFEALINDVLRNMINRFIFVYLDDILIFSRSSSEHEQHVRQVLQRLLKNKLYVKAEKCEFHVPTVSFLGYIISQGQVQTDPAKVKAVFDWPVPTNLRQLQRFLGFAKFYRRFIRNYSSLAAPLVAIPSTSTPFHWTPEAEAAFVELKAPFCLCPPCNPTRSSPSVHCGGGCFRYWGRCSAVSKIFWQQTPSLCILLS